MVTTVLVLVLLAVGVVCPAAAADGRPVAASARAGHLSTVGARAGQGEKAPQSAPTAAQAVAASPDTMKSLQESRIMKVDSDPAKALAYIYRPSRFSGRARTYTVFCDEIGLADMENGRYFIIRVDPGRHVLRSEDGRKIEVELAGGETYFFEVSLKSGDGEYSSRWSAWGHVEVAEPATALKEMQSLQPAKKKRIKSADLVVGTYLE